jgi:hypothetical protein
MLILFKIIFIYNHNYFYNYFKVTKPKLCINCKHYIPSNNNGKCSLFPNEESEINFLVNGNDEKNYYNI